MAIEVARPSSVINFDIGHNISFGIQDKSINYSYCDENFNKSDDIEFEEDRHSPQKEKVYLLFDNPDKLKIQIDILNRAEQISQKMSRAIHNRKGRRIRRQFVCLYLAHIELGIETYSPQGIADIVGLPYEDISAAITDFSPLRSGYKPIRRADSSIHPSARIAADYAKQLDMNDGDIEHIKMIITDALAANPKIKSRKTATIAIGGVAACVYLTQKKDITTYRLYELSKISESTIIQARNQILDAYNS